MHRWGCKERVPDPGWLSSQNFSAPGIGYLRNRRAMEGPYADNEEHLEGPWAGRRKLKVTPRDSTFPLQVVAGRGSRPTPGDGRRSYFK